MAGGSGPAGSGGRTHRHVFHAEWVGQRHISLARRAYRSVRVRIHALRVLVAQLNFSQAVARVPALLGNAYQFAQLVDDLASAARKLECGAQETQQEARALSQRLKDVWDGGVAGARGKTNGVAAQLCICVCVSVFTR